MNIPQTNFFNLFFVWNCRLCEIQRLYQLLDGYFDVGFQHPYAEALILSAPQFRRTAIFFFNWPLQQQTTLYRRTESSLGLDYLGLALDTIRKKEDSTRSTDCSYPWSCLQLARELWGRAGRRAVAETDGLQSGIRSSEGQEFFD